jgi:hypothetical protein
MSMTRKTMTISHLLTALALAACGPLPPKNGALDAGPTAESDAGDAADPDGMPVDAANPEPMRCQYNGRSYELGEQFPSSSGCGICRCLANQEVGCTAGHCVDAGQDAGPGCTWNGQHYAEGEYFPAGDDCNGCTCSNGQPMCTACACFDGGTPGEDGGSAFKCGAW